MFIVIAKAGFQIPFESFGITEESEEALRKDVSGRA